MFGKSQKTTTALALAAFLATSITPAVAADFKGLPDMRYNPYAAHSQTRAATAGVYLRVPFKGGLKRPMEETRVGLALSTKLSGRSGKPGHFAAAASPKLFDLSLGLSSLGQGRQPLSQSLRFNGISLNQVKALNADEDGQKKRGGLKSVLIAAAVIGAVVGVVAVAAEVEEIKNTCFFCFEE